MSYSIDTGLGRLLWEYRDKPNVRSLITAMLVEYENISDALADLKTRLDIDLSVGEQLDGIGEIIGQSRLNSLEINDDDVFAFDGGTGLGFGGVDRDDIGGQFTGIDGLVVGAMTDSQYRKLLRAVISVASGNSSLDHIGEYCEAVLGEGVSISDGVGFIGITVPRPMSAYEAALIRTTIPLAAGVRLGYLAYSPEAVDGVGGFDDVDGNGVEYSGEFVGLA